MGLLSLDAALIVGIMVFAWEGLCGLLRLLPSASTGPKDAMSNAMFTQIFRERIFSGDRLCQGQRKAMTVE